MRIYDAKTGRFYNDEEKAQFLKNKGWDANILDNPPSLPKVPATTGAARSSPAVGPVQGAQRTTPKVTTKGLMAGPPKLSMDGLMLNRGGTQKPVQNARGDLRGMNAGVLSALPARAGVQASGGLGKPSAAASSNGAGSKSPIGPMQIALQKREAYAALPGQKANRQREIQRLANGDGIDEFLRKETLNDDEKKLANELLKELDKKWGTIYRKKQGNRDGLGAHPLTEEEAIVLAKMDALRAKSDWKEAALYGVLDSVTFGVSKKLEEKSALEQLAHLQGLNGKMTPKEAAQLLILESRGGKSVFDAAQEQNPTAYGISKFLGETGKYALGGAAFDAIPAAAAAAGKTGAWIAQKTGGKVSAAVAQRLLEGRLVDLPFDVIAAAVEADSAGEFAQSLGISQATGLAADAGMEGLAAGWKAIKKAVKEGQLKALLDPAAIQDGDIDAYLRKQGGLQPKIETVDGVPAQREMPVMAETDAVKPQAADGDMARAGGNVEILPEVYTEKQLQEAYRYADAVHKELKRFAASSGITLKEKEQAKAVQKGLFQLSQLDPESLERVNEYIRLQEQLEKALYPLKNYDASRREILNNQMESVLEGSDQWKDKSKGFFYNRETMERNIEDIIPNKDEATYVKQEIFTPIHQNEAKRQRFLREWRGKVQELGLNKEESTLVQLLGEGKISLNEIPKNINADVIEKAARIMRDEIYPALLEMANGALVRNGYRPIRPRKNYFPHFNDPEDPLTKALGKFGIKVNLQELPTDIAGRTHTFKPGKQWFGAFMERKGDKTVYDALRGFDLYTEGISNVVYHTEDIQRLRAFEESIRLKYSDKGVAERIREIRNSNDWSFEEKEKQIAAILDTQKNSHLPNFVTSLRNYTDALAGKKALGDRTFEQNVGRGVYSTMQALEGRVAANMVAVNPGSWLTNFIPLVQAGDVKTTNLILGMWDTLKDSAGGISKRLQSLRDGLTETSDFLTNRRGAELLSRTGLEKVQDTLARPMSWIDNFTSGSIVRAKYRENIKNGMKHMQALAQADDYAARLITDRSKGALPTVFHSKNPGAKLLTMFQAEVNNQLSFLFKDLPREAAQQGKLAVAEALAKYAVGAYIFNDVYQRLVGRRPALDPIGMLNETVGEATGYMFPNITQLPQAIGDLREGDAQGFQTGKERSIVKAGAGLAKNVAENIPFVGGLLGGGRVPISSALPNISKLWDAGAGGLSGEVNPRTAWNRIGKELVKPAAYLLPPVGGGQIKKTLEGVSTVLDGGVYGVDGDGRRRLLFPAEKNLGNLLTGAIFGRYALPEGRNYAESGFKAALTSDETSAMEQAGKIGVSQDNFLRLTLDMKGVESDKDGDGKVVKSANDKRRELLLSNPNLTPGQKQALDKLLIGKGVSPARNYQSSDEFIISNMSEKNRALWKQEDVREAVGDAGTYAKIMDAVGQVKGDVDEYGQTISGSVKYKKIEAIAQAMDVSNGRAGTVYEVLFEHKYDMSEFSTQERRRYEQGPAKIGVSKDQFIHCMNTIQNVKGTDEIRLDDARVDALTEAGYPEQKAKAFVKSMFQDNYSIQDLSKKESDAYRALKERFDVTEGNFLKALNTVQSVQGVKGENGKTISGSQKKARYQALAALPGWSAKGAKVFLMEVYGYKDGGWT